MCLFWRQPACPENLSLVSNRLQYIRRKRVILRLYLCVCSAGRDPDDAVLLCRSRFCASVLVVLGYKFKNRPRDNDSEDILERRFYVTVSTN